MKRFVFSLQSVLELREREEDDAKQALADKEAELRDRKKDVESAQNELQAYLKSQKVSRSGPQTAVELRHSVSWRNKLKLDLIKVAQQMQDVQMDIERARQVLVEATAKRKTMEILKDKQFDAWKKERDRKEQQFLDELSINAHIRKKRTQ